MIGLALFQEKGLRIAWQYKKYFGDDQESANAIGNLTDLNLIVFGWCLISMNNNQ